MTRPHDGWQVSEIAGIRGGRRLGVTGEMDMSTTPQLAEMIERRRALGHAIELDLSDVAFMDSTGLTLLLDLDRAARLEGWSFAVISASRFVRRVAELAGVERLLPPTGNRRAPPP